MAITANSYVTAQTISAFTLDMSAQSAVTTRAPTAQASLATANIVMLATAASTVTTTANTNGRQIKRITVKACGTVLATANAANVLMVWQAQNATASAFLRDELLVTAVTASATSNSFQTSKEYSDWNIPASAVLYASLGTATTATATALCVTVDAADL